MGSSALLRKRRRRARRRPSALTPHPRYSKAYSLGVPKWIDLNPGAPVLPSARCTLFWPAAAKREPESHRLMVPPCAAYMQVMAGRTSE
jgi:hypothetical protein